MPDLSEMRRVAFLCALLYGLYFALLTALRLAANSQGVLLGEEASSSFVEVAYFSMRLQHDTFATNIGAYWIFWLASWLPSAPDLFYGRAVKVIFSASLPVWIFLLLHVRLKVAKAPAFAASVCMALLPGILSFGWYGLEMALDLSFALPALFFALGESAPGIAASGLLLGQAMLTYGTSVLFVPAMACLWYLNFRKGNRRAVLCAILLFLLPFAASVVWWTNVQALLVGGGLQDRPPVRYIVRVLLTDLFSRNSSYYFFTNGRPAMGSLWIGCLSLIATLYSLRAWKQNWIWLSIIGSGMVLSLISGGPPGVRRVVPVVVALGILTTLFLVELGSNLGRKFPTYFAWIFAAAVLGHLSFHAFGYWADLANSRIALSRDFRFENLPGLNMAETYAAMRDRVAPLPSDYQKYEPDRLLGVLYMTARARPVVLPEQLLRDEELRPTSVEPNDTRFQHLLE